MLKVAITGNIASGKSEVEKILRDKSYKVLDTDDAVHNLFNDEKVKNKIVLVFKDYDILENGCISRPKLGKVVFYDEDLRKKLESILHPLVKEKIKQFFQQNKDEKIVFVSVPLLFEAKFENLFDKIILLYATDGIRLKRLIKRSNLTEEYAKMKLKSQMNQDEKIALSDFVIYNDKTLDVLNKNLEEILNLI